MFGRADWSISASNSPAADLPMATTATITATLIDAVPVTTSVSLALPPLGSYTVNLKSPTKSSQACLGSEQKTAWSCVSKVSLNLDVELVEENATVTLTYSAPEPPYRWGAQPPTFNGHPTVTVVTDKGDLAMGPAYYFQQIFDKIVVLQEEEFNLSMMKRSLTGAGDHNDHQVVDERDDGGEYEDYLLLEERDDAKATDVGSPKSTDKPWFCVWNETILEGFIFIAHNYTSTTDSETASPDMDSGAYPDPAAESSTAINAAQTTFPPPPEAAAFSSENSAGARPTPQATAWKHKRQDTSPPNYPKIVKLEERRLPHSGPPPYCQQMQMKDGTPSPLYDASNQKIIQYLNETEPDGPHKRRRSWFEILSTTGKRASSTNDGCQCQWKIE